MATEAEKAIAACIAYARAGADVARLTKVIGEALNACATAHLEKYAGCVTNGEYPPEWESHLKQAYEFEEDDDYFGDSRRVYMDAEEQAEFLAQCPHCLAAHTAIQQRKEARKKFGAAKRYVGSIGRRNQKPE